MILSFSQNKLKTLSIITVFLFTAIIVAETADAKSRSRSYSSSRSSSYSSSSYKSSSYSPSKSVWGQRSGGGIFGSKPTSTSKSVSTSSSGYKKPTSAKTQSSGYTKPGSTKSSQASAAKSTAASSGYQKPSSKKSSFNYKKSTFDKKAALTNQKKKAAASLSAYKKEKSKFNKPATPISKGKISNNPILNKTRTYSNHDYRTAYDRRDSYYQNRGWNSPGYAFSSRPRFGIWDGLFWWMILDNLTQRPYYAMAHHHSNDPGYAEWRSEANRLAASNQELKTKLNQLDNKVAEMEGTPKDAAYLPDDIPAEIAVAADVMAERRPTNPVFTIATASQSGNYHRFGTFLKTYGNTVDVKLRTTAGSMENLSLLAKGDVDAAIVQSDAFAVYQKMNKKRLPPTEQTPLYTEAVQMIANKKSGIHTVKDLLPHGKHILYIGPKGSGTAMTWKGFCDEDSHYRSIKTRHASYEEALKVVQKNKNAVMMFVSGLNSSLLKKAEALAKRTKTVRLVQVNDWDFNDTQDQFGNDVYSFVEIPSDTYPNLQKGFFTGKTIETIGVNAVLAVRTDWAKTYGPEALDALTYAVLEAQPLISVITNGLSK